MMRRPLRTEIAAARAGGCRHLMPCVMRNGRPACWWWTPPAEPDLELEADAFWSATHGDTGRRRSHGTMIVSVERPAQSAPDTLGEGDARGALPQPPLRVCCSYCPDGRPAIGLRRDIPVCETHT